MNNEIIDMTEEQFNKAILLNEQIKKIKHVKDRICTDGVFLEFVRSSSSRIDVDRVLNSQDRSAIAEILKKHSDSIKNDIDEAISKLENDIKSL